MSKTALIAGATGLVGEELVKILLEEDYYTKIKILSRRPVELNDNRVETILLKDFLDLDDVSEQMAAEDYYCALGTTIKKAGSRSEFEKVDLTYPLKLAEIAKGYGSFQQYLVVTASGGRENSPVFYNRVKGQLERKLKEMNLPALKIFKPTILLGKRKEFRLGERIAQILSTILSFFMLGSQKGVFSIHSRQVARAMFLVAKEQQPGVGIFSSGKMIKIAKSGGN